MPDIVAPWNFASNPSDAFPNRNRMQTPIAEFPVSNENEVKSAVQRARLLATLVELPDRQRTSFGRAVRELCQNAITHSTGARVAFRVESNPDGAFVEAAVFDNGGRQQEIESIIAQTNGPDCGLRRAITLSDRLQIECNDNGKVISAAIRINAQAADVDETDVAEWTGMLRKPATQNALASTRRRSRALAERLATLQNQRAQLEADLEQSKSLNETLTLLSLVASKTDNAVIIMDGKGLVTWANDAFIRMTGYTTQDAVGARPDHLLTGPQTSRDSARELEQAFKLGHGVAEEFLQYRREGSTSWISLSLTPVHDDDGAVTRWIGIGADITKRREAELALKAARDAAETASQLKGEFLANISHEIRTPMNAIIGMTDLSLCTDLDDIQRDYLNTVKQSAESLLELLNDVLDLSKIESGRLEIDEVPFDIFSVVKDTLKPLAFVAKQKNLQLGVSISSDVPQYIIGDALRLRQILINLVGNAIKFTIAGHVEVNVQMQWQTDGEVGLQFTVADTGVGIAADKLDRIFEAFNQADSSITRQFGGTGLGLAITSQLLRLMKGRVWVQSEPDKGSRFHFTLKSRLATSAEQAKLATDKATAAAAYRKNTSKAAGRPLNVLVADDHPANRQLIARILEKRGHTMQFAQNGHEVLAQFDNSGCDVILMDVQMPRMGGFEATAAIRERERETQTHVPIIAVTAHAMQSDREACLAAGMDAYLSKPISAMDLITLVDSLSNNQTNLSATSATSTGFVTIQGANEPPKGNMTGQPSADTVRSGTHSESQRTTPPKISGTPTKKKTTVDFIHSPKPAFSAALQRLDNDEELLREQMEYFLRDGPELLQMVETSIGNTNAAGLQIAAHRLKNLCATFDDNDTAAICGQVEVAASAQDWNAVACYTETLLSGTRQLISQIQSFCC